MVISDSEAEFIKVKCKKLQFHMLTCRVQSLNRSTEPTQTQGSNMYTCKQNDMKKYTTKDSYTAKFHLI